MRCRWMLLMLVVTTASCTAVRYQAPQFDAQTATHREVAVLPFEMVLEGKLPAELTQEQLEWIEERESLDFQRGLYHALLNQSGAGERRIRIRLQAVEETNRILENAGISIRRSWTMSPERLAKILGVDAVVRTRVEKLRLLSDGASAGIDVGTRVFHEATRWRFGGLIPHGAAATHEIFADATLLSGEDGVVLWEVAVERTADWQRPAHQVVEGVARKLAKTFPYRT